MAESMRRTFEFSRVFNFRDLGGYSGLDGRQVRWRRLFRSDNLAGLGEPDRPVFTSLGVRTVLDLRRPYECQDQGQAPAWDGLAYHNIDPDHPEWAETPYQPELEPSRYLADRYRDMAEHGARGLATAIELVAERQSAPVVVHCVAGKDRTGVVCALTLSLLGVSDEDIDGDYTLSTRGNQRYVAWARANGHPELAMRPWFYSPPGTMALFLHELRQRHGSVESYLSRAGLATDRIEALRDHLLD